MNHRCSKGRFALLALTALATRGFAQSEFDIHAADVPPTDYAIGLQGVSDDGRVVVWLEGFHDFSSSYPDFGTSLIVDGQRVVLPEGSYEDAFGLGVSGDGRVVVGYGSGAPQQAIYWEDGVGPFELTSPVPGSYTRAELASADGRVIVGRELGFPSSRAIRWVDGVPSIVEPPAGWGFVFFYGMTRDGSQLAGSLYNYNQGPPVFQAVRWSETTGYTPLELPVGALFSEGRGQSEDGQWTVGFISLGAAQDRAAAWDSTGAYVDLHQPGWTRSQAVAMDASGTKVLILVGFGASVPYLYDLTTGEAQLLRDVLELTGGPSLALEDMLFPTGLSADGSTVIGDRSGSTLDALVWVTRINGFGQKVCGTAAANSTGTGASLLGQGSLSVSSNSAELTATLLPPGEFGFFLASQTLDPMVLPGNQAMLCLGGDIGRFNAPGQVGMSGADGTLSLSLDLGSLAQPMGTVAGMAGETWYFQAWFRDTNPLPTSNFTDALSATLTQ